MNRPQPVMGDPRLAPFIALREMLPIPQVPREERHLLRLAAIRQAVRG